MISTVFTRIMLSITITPGGIAGFAIAVYWPFLEHLTRTEAPEEL